MSKYLLNTEPRIVFGSAAGTRPDKMASLISITPYMMVPGDERIVAQRLHETLSKPPKMEDSPAPPQGEPVSIAGQWQLDLEFDRGTASHT